MTLSTECPRRFEAEAMRDGRLGGAELASFERHLTLCRACAREARALDGLAQSVCALGTSGADELHVRRERTRLLAAFEHALVAPRARFRNRPGRLVAAFCAALVVGGLLLLRVAPARQAARAASAVIHAERDTVFSQRDDGAREEIVLERGMLSIHVDHRAGQRSELRVVLPDGELEDIGTTFRVRVDDAHTTEVAVQEGRVVLRLHARPALTIAAGGRWAPAPAVATTPAPTLATRTAPDTAPSTSAIVTSVNTRMKRAPSSAAPAVSRLRPSTQSSAATPSQAAARALAADAFRAATTALHAGRHRAAADALADFLAAYPDDARAEDAAYLRVIALQRCGDTRALHDAARAYLRLYPSGFRYAEVKRLLGGTDERSAGGD